MCVHACVRACVCNLCCHSTNDLQTLIREGDLLADDGGDDDGGGVKGRVNSSDDPLKKLL